MATKKPTDIVYRFKIDAWTPDTMPMEHRVNKLLREDNGVAAIRQRGAEIIRFLGALVRLP